MKSRSLFLRFSFFLYGLLLVMMVSCEKEPDTDPADPKTDLDSPTTGPLEPDEAAELLVLKNATKITGEMPTAPDGQLQISVEDTIYLANGMPYGTRLLVKHDGQQDISGFYVGVLNSSFYFDVPVVAGESGDSTEVLYLNIKDLGGMDWGGFPIEILPHGPGNLPFKKFIRQVKVESPKDGDNCSPLIEPGVCHYNDQGHKICFYPDGLTSWFWEFTVLEDATGDIHTAYAPFMFISNPPFKHGGCCWNGTSIPSKYDPYCVPGNPEYHEVTVDDAYYVRHFEGVDLFTDNTYGRHVHFESQNYSDDSSNYCAGEAGYIRIDHNRLESGTHNFSPGDKNINFSILEVATNDPYIIDEWGPVNAEIFYTCNNLILSQMINGQKWSGVYKRNARNFSLTQTPLYPQFWD